MFSFFYLNIKKPSHVTKNRRTKRPTDLLETPVFLTEETEIQNHIQGDSSKPQNNHANRPPSLSQASRHLSKRLPTDNEEPDENRDDNQESVTESLVIDRQNAKNIIDKVFTNLDF